MYLSLGAANYLTDLHLCPILRHHPPPPHQKHIANYTPAVPLPEGLVRSQFFPMLWPVSIGVGVQAGRGHPSALKPIPNGAICSSPRGKIMRHSVVVAGSGTKEVRVWRAQLTSLRGSSWRGPAPGCGHRAARRGSGGSGPGGNHLGNVAAVAHPGRTPPLGRLPEFGNAGAPAPSAGVERSSTRRIGMRTCPVPGPGAGRPAGSAGGGHPRRHR
jgi:hypothetical protein